MMQSGWVGVQGQWSQFERVMEQYQRPGSAFVLQLSLGSAQNTNVEHIREGVLHLIFTIRSSHHWNPA